MLIALQLCRIALPLMTVVECSQVVVPAHPSLVSRPSHKASGRSLAANIVGLLLAKLAEYIVPDASQVSSIWSVWVGWCVFYGVWNTRCLIRLSMRHTHHWRSRCQHQYSITRASLSQTTARHQCISTRERERVQQRSFSPSSVRTLVTSGEG